MKSSDKQTQSIVVGQTIIGFLLAWAMIYNMVIKEHGFTAAFFKILDTITEDMVMGSLVTVFVGLGIVLVFTVTKLYTQIISRDSSFRILEKIFYEELGQQKYRSFAQRLLNFEQEDEPESVHPLFPSSVLISFAFLYLMSWIYLILFSEALFFVSWSAGVDLPIGKDNVELLPLLALSIPFQQESWPTFDIPIRKITQILCLGQYLCCYLLLRLVICFAQMINNSFCFGCGLMQSFSVLFYRAV